MEFSCPQYFSNSTELDRTRLHALQGARWTANGFTEAIFQPGSPEFVLPDGCDFGAAGGHTEVRLTRLASRAKW